MLQVCTGLTMMRIVVHLVGHQERGQVRMVMSCLLSAAFVSLFFLHRGNHTTFSSVLELVKSNGPACSRVV